MEDERKVIVRFFLIEFIQKQTSYTIAPLIHCGAVQTVCFYLYGPA